jgi:hypothetical protein
MYEFRRSLVTNLNIPIMASKTPAPSISHAGLPSTLQLGLLL